MRALPSPALSAVVASALVALALACSTSSSATEGGSCFYASDCAPGLICVAAADGKRTCTSDLSKTQKGLPAERDAAASDAAPTSDAAPEKDAAEVKDSAPPVVDAAPDVADAAKE